MGRNSRPFHFSRQKFKSEKISLNIESNRSRSSVRETYKRQGRRTSIPRSLIFHFFSQGSGNLLFFFQRSILSIFSLILLTFDFKLLSTIMISFKSVVGLSFLLPLLHFVNAAPQHVVPRQSTEASTPLTGDTSKYSDAAIWSNAVYCNHTFGDQINGAAVYGAFGDGGKH